MNKLRKWIINKLGGFTIDDVKFKEVVENYWDKESVNATLYVSPSKCTKEYAKSIELELARLLGVEFLKRGCIWFSGPYKDNDDLRIQACCIGLKIHERTSCHWPDHLTFKETDDV